MKRNGFLLINLSRVSSSVLQNNRGAVKTGIWPTNVNNCWQPCFNNPVFSFPIAGLIEAQWIKAAQNYYPAILEVRVWTASLGWNQDVSRAHSFLETPGENLLPCLFQLLKSLCVLLALFLHLWSQKCWAESPSCWLLSVSSSSVSPLRYKDPLTTSGSLG